MRKRIKNHISASRHLCQHPKRMAKAGAWRPGKRGGHYKWKKPDSQKR